MSNFNLLKFFKNFFFYNYFRNMNNMKACPMTKFFEIMPTAQYSLFFNNILKRLRAKNP